MDQGVLVVQLDQSGLEAPSLPEPPEQVQGVLEVPSIHPFHLFLEDHVVQGVPLVHHDHLDPWNEHKSKLQVQLQVQCCCLWGLIVERHLQRYLE